MPQDPPRPRVVILLGPTAVGKSALLETLVPTLRAWRAEVVNADSRQVYRSMDAGTAKPSPQLCRLLPHHLIDIVDPEVQFTVGGFVRAAERLVAQIHGRHGVAIVAGGAAFYLWSFLHGLSAAPPPDPVLRRRLRARARQEGSAALHRELARCDPPSAERLPAGDTNRIVRALEVYQLSGRPLSAFPPPTAQRRDYDLLTVGLHRERPELYARIDRRVAQMFASGLSAEVAALRARGYHADTPGMRSIGYAEFFSEASEAETRMLIARNSRRLAKRQLTFFRRFSDLRWFPAADVAAIEAALQEFCGPASRSAAPPPLAIPAAP